MKFILLSILSSSLFALVTGDIMKGKVLKAYKGNYLILNRGIEDGIFKGEHIKITNKQGYVARAICIKPRLLISHCKVYRVVNPELLSLDSDYKLSSIKQSEIPKDLNFLRDINYDDRFNDFTDKDINKSLPIQNERIVNFDLANDFNPDSLKPRDSSTRIQASLDKNFSKKKLKEDLKKINLSLYASPLSFQSQGGSYSQDYGINLSNEGSKYKFDLSYRSRKNKIVNQFTDESIKQVTTHFILGMELKDFSDDYSAISLIDIQDQKFDNIKTPLNSNKVGIIGAKFKFSNKSSFSYIPTFEKTTLTSTKENKEKSLDFIRHRILYSYTAPITDHSQISFNVDLQPELTFDELTSESSVGFIVDLSKRFSLNYRVSLLTNTLIEKYYNLDNTNLINTFHLNYSL